MLTRCAIAFVVLATMTTSGFAKSIFFRHDISDDFSWDEKKAIIATLGVLGDLFASDAVEACTNQLSTRFLLSSGIDDIYKNFDLDGRLLYAQLSQLRKRKVPRIRINAYERDDWSYGEANLDLVKVYDNRIEGSFRIALNRHHLRNFRYDAAIASEMRNWAGVIGHEMLHNLSHLHPSADKVGLDQAYTTDFQINAFQTCINSAGRSTRSNYASKYRCGGREKR